MRDAIHRRGAFVSRKSGKSTRQSSTLDWSYIVPAGHSTTALTAAGGYITLAKISYRSGSLLAWDTRIRICRRLTNFNATKHTPQFVRILKVAGGSNTARARSTP